MVVKENTAGIAPRAPARPLVTFRADDARYSNLPNYILGLHDTGGEAHMLAAGRPGWVAVSVQVNPADSTGDFAALAEQGLGVIVRLNHGYSGAGTLPNSTRYDEFALNCAAFVGSSRGAHLWIIGNEPNAAAQRSGYDGTTNSGEVITPEMYARCFNKCRKAIRALPGHENDWVIPAAVGTFNTQTNYPNNPSGDWVRYFADVLFQITIQGGAADGLALHTYTHGYDATLVSSDALAGGHFANRHWHLRAYRDYLQAVLPAMRNLPVFITEAQPLDPGWTNQNRGWIQAAAAEVNAWNANPANQPIQALCFFRWQSLPGDPYGWGMMDKPAVVADLRAALQNDYRVRWPGVQPTPDYRAQWLAALNVPLNTMTTGESLSGRLVVKNIGAKAWLAQGPNRVAIGYHWYNAQGVEIPVLPEPGHIALPQNVLPGQTAIVDNVELRAPQWQGTYTAKFDLVQEGNAWFSALGAATKDLTVTVNAPAYALEWEQVLTVTNNAMATNANVIGAVTVKNTGSRAWYKKGANAVRLGYHWYNAQGVETPVAPYAGHFEMAADTPPGKSATFNGVILRSPQYEGTYTLRWDLVQEGLTWFSAKGAAAASQTVTVTTPLPDLAANWVKVFDLPLTLEPNETVSGPLTVQNVGAQTWSASGESPVRLGYHWYDPLGNEVLIAPYAGNFPLARDVLPKETLTVEEVVVRAPIPRGKYTLAFDLVKEGVTWFSATGSRPLEVTVTVKTDALDYFAQWAETPAIPQNTLTVGDIHSGRVVIKNAGAMSWESDGEDRVLLGYRWFDAAGKEAPTVTPARKFSLPHTVPPRESVTLDDVTLQTPDAAGEYTLKWDLLHEPARWFSAGGSPVAEAAVTIKPPPLPWGADFVAHNTPPNLAVGQTTIVDFRIKNVGKNIWKAGGAQPVYAGYKWLNAAGEAQGDAEDHRTLLPADVRPGSEAEFAAMLAAPQTPGLYRLQWDLIAGNTAWFGEGGNPALLLPVKVTAAPTPTNLWRAEASHNAASPLLALDGDLSSFWSSQTNQAPGMWFRVNLGAPQLIDGLAFRSPGHGYPAGYTVRVSTDGQAWRTVWGVAQGNARDIVAHFAPYRVLYAQVDLIAPLPAEWKIAEAQIHCSPTWSATASINSESAPSAIDNSPATAWTTNAPQSPNTWFQLDLGRVECVSGLQFVPPKDEIPLGYRVSVWNQPAGGWQKIAERTNNAEPINLVFAPVQTQYVNVQLLQAADKPWAIREVRVTRAMVDWVGPTSGGQ